MYTQLKLMTHSKTLPPGNKSGRCTHQLRIKQLTEPEPLHTAITIMNFDNELSSTFSAAPVPPPT